MARPERFELPTPWFEAVPRSLSAEIPPEKRASWTFAKVPASSFFPGLKLTHAPAGRGCGPPERLIESTVCSLGRGGDLHCSGWAGACLLAPKSCSQSNGVPPVGEETLVHLRSRHHRQRARRVCDRYPRRAVGPEDRCHREGRLPGRHLPARGLYPHQGPATPCGDLRALQGRRIPLPQAQD